MREKKVVLLGVCLLAGVIVAAFVCLPLKAKRVSVETVQAEFYDASVSDELPESIANDDNLSHINPSDYTIVIDAGHGGSDPGKTNGDVLEKDINLSIALQLEAVLNRLGYRTVMTRSTDAGLYSDSDTNKKRADLKKRCDIANSSNADIMISIHQNSFSSSTVSGAQVFYYTYSANGKQLASILQQSLKTNLDTSNTRVEKEDKTYYLLINSKVPTVIVECGFLTNTNELKLLLSGEYQMKAVEAVTLGINQYFAAKKK